MRLRLKLSPALHKDGHLKDQFRHFEIPINYNGTVARFVYELLEPDQPFGSSDEGIPYYTFTNLYIPSVSQQGSVLAFAWTESDLTISLLIEPEHEQELLERLMRPIEMVFATGTRFTIARIEVLNEFRSFAERVRFRMASPLATPYVLGEDGVSAVPLHFGTPEFSQVIRELLIARYLRLHGTAPRDDRFELILDQGYLQRRRGKISKLVTIDEGEGSERKIKAIVAPFMCEGNPELIRLGYVAGFGEKSVLGFGCAELAGIPVLVNRTIELGRANTFDLATMSSGGEMEAIETNSIVQSVAGS